MRRTIRRLVELADRYREPCCDGIRIALPISQQELAGWVGVSREAANKALHRLRDRGLVSLDRRQLVVVDLDALRLLTV